MQAIRPVILCGGGGSRLWPLSSPQRPKQFLALAGERTMLQETALRVARRGLFADPILVTGAGHAEEAARQLDDVGVTRRTLLIEPRARNTAAAITLAVRASAPDDLLLVMPSDHVVDDVDAFCAAVERGMHAAQDGWIVTLGVTPDRPETGYGYIEQGEPIGGGVRVAAAFIEKPDPIRAESLAASRRHYWNAGLFLFRADTMAAALRQHAPEVWDAVAAACAAGTGGAPDANLFGGVPAISIDHSVMERADRIAVVPVEMGWSDVGSWNALYAIGDKDAAGNVMTDLTESIGARNSLMVSSGRRIVAIDVDDLVIVETPDAVLVMRKGCAQEVGRIPR